MLLQNGNDYLIRVHVQNNDGLPQLFVEFFPEWSELEFYFSLIMKNIMSPISNPVHLTVCQDGWKCTRYKSVFKSFYNGELLIIRPTP